MSQFSEFLLKRIEENNLTKKRSIRELSREIGISHDYLGRIIHGKVIAPEGEIYGELQLKRQYDIENSILNSFNDVDTVSNDEILKPYKNA